MKYTVLLILSILFGLVLLSIFVPFLFSVANNANIGQQSLSWPSVPGRVTQSKMSIVKRPVIDCSRTAGCTEYNRTEYLANITFSYTINNIVYYGATLAFSGADAYRNSSSPAGTKPLLSKYPLGKNVTVHYNPANMSEATLQTGYSIGYLGITAFIVAIGALLVIIPILILRKKGKGTQQPAQKQETV